MRTPVRGLVPILAVDRRSSRPLGQQLYEAYRTAIVEQQIHPGQPLPSSRTLAAELHVSRIVVVTAFEQLRAEGYVETSHGSGTFATRTLPEQALAAPGDAARPSTRRGPRRVARLPALEGTSPEPWTEGFGAFRLSQPALDQFPFHVWARLCARHAKNPRRSLLAYGETLGYRPLREALAHSLRITRGVRCGPEQIMVVSGSQQGLDLCARVLVDAGAEVWVEEPGYAGARNAFALAGAQLVPVPVDAEGLNVTRGVALSPRARVAYVTPSHQFPLGMTLSAARRMQLLGWARRQGAWLIEDDYDSEYRYESLPIAALQGLDRAQRVIYLGTLSKVLFPALRLGYLVLPPDLVPAFRRVREAMDIFPASFHQAVLADFIAEGHFARHLRRMRVLYRERRTALVAALRAELGADCELLGDQAGMHLVLALPGVEKDREVALRAGALGLRVKPLSETWLGRPARQGLVLGYGAVPARHAREAVRLLARALGR
jgi:GntR family transcriptional regulator/MocR family aminotransferase